MENAKKKPEESIISAIFYYKIQERPLTSVELFRYACPTTGLKFSQLLFILKKQSEASKIRQFLGFYFLDNNCRSGFRQRQKRGKISQLKWKKAKRMGQFLQITPFLEMIGVTGSLSLDNAKEESDIDLLIVLKPGRLWIGRTFITLFLSLMGWRRHGAKTRDRACLNSYLAGQDMEIKAKIKPRSLHSAQEYSRFAPIWQKKDSLPPKFHKQNAWIGDYLENYPWPGQFNFKTAKNNRLLGFFRITAEYILNGFLGDKIETSLAAWQTERIKRKIINSSDPADQIYFSNEYLMFHPHSKSAKIMQEHQNFFKATT